MPRAFAGRVRPLPRSVRWHRGLVDPLARRRIDEAGRRAADHHAIVGDARAAACRRRARLPSSRTVYAMPGNRRACTRGKKPIEFGAQRGAVDLRSHPEANREMIAFRKHPRDDRLARERAAIVVHLERLDTFRPLAGVCGIDAILNAGQEPAPPFGRTRRPDRRRRGARSSLARETPTCARIFLRVPALRVGVLDHRRRRRRARASGTAWSVRISAPSAAARARRSCRRVLPASSCEPDRGVKAYVFFTVESVRRGVSRCTSARGRSNSRTKPGPQPRRTDPLRADHGVALENDGGDARARRFAGSGAPGRTATDDQKLRRLHPSRSGWRALVAGFLYLVLGNELERIRQSKRAKRGGTKLDHNERFLYVIHYPGFCRGRIVKRNRMTAQLGIELGLGAGITRDPLRLVPDFVDFCANRPETRRCKRSPRRSKKARWPSSNAST